MVLLLYWLTFYTNNLIFLHKMVYVFKKKVKHQNLPERDYKYNFRKTCSYNKKSEFLYSMQRVTLEEVFFKSS